MKDLAKSLQISISNYQAFGRLFFTPKQLYYEFCRTANLPFYKQSLPIFSKISNVIKTPQTLEIPISWEEFERIFNNYLINNNIPNLLSIKPQISFNLFIPNDLTLYGLPKLLICETDEIAQMLRANQFHLQTSCGILSLSEASPLPENFNKMMHKSENPQVYFLHNASLEAFSIIKNLRQIIELEDDISLRPIGLRPVHAKRLNLFSLKTNPQNFDFVEINYLSEEEKQWLTKGNKAEIAAISPVRLMRALRRIILDLEVSPSIWQIKLPKKELGFM